MSKITFRIINLDEVVAGFDLLEKALEGIKGVRSVKVVSATKQATVEHDDVDTELFLEAIRNEGFEVKVVDEEPARQS